MMRSTLLWLSERQSIFNFVRKNRLARHFASRFVAGESLDTALQAVRDLEAHGITTTLDLLGESVSRPAEADQARDMYVAILRGMQEAGVEVNASVKLTQMGLDIDEALCERNTRAILDVAREVGAFVRLDMESSEYTDRTLDFFEQRLFPEYGNHVGVVLQSALRRTTADAERMIALGARVRLCKGAYLEPPSVAYEKKADVDAHYVRLMEALVARGRYPGIATHDEAMITATRDFVTREQIPADRFEFQMLYGVRRDLQERLVAEGYRMRVYVPFGTQWYPYLMRRLAERPANIAFIVGNVLKEGFRRR